MCRICIYFLILSTLASISLASKNEHKLIKNKKYSDNYYANSIIEGKAKAIDGDSLVIQNKQIRLFNVDAPEWDQKCSKTNGHKYKCGKAAHDYLIKLVNDGRIKCKVLKKDNYDRFLSICTNAQNKNLSIELIKAGWAIPYYTNSDYYQYKHNAKKQRIGIWQGKFMTPRTYRKLTK